MKNQYVGDITDYMTYGLIRSIVSATDWSVFIAWMLTPDDGSNDGRFTKYLSDEAEWARYDPRLFQVMKEIVHGSQRRDITLVEQSGILSNCEYFSDLVPDDADGRRYWFESLVQKLNEIDLLFLSPDNGFEVKSKPFGRTFAYCYYLSI